MSQEASPTAVCRVGISGSYGGLNLGDEAILQGIVGELTRSLPVEITVFSRDAADTRARHPDVARVVPVRDFSRSEVLPEIERLDVFVLGGGGILFDGEAKIYLREVQLALECGVPVMVYAVSAGPLRIDGAAHRVFARTGAEEQAVPIGPTEYRLLHFIMTHPERVYSRAQLLDHVWGGSVYVEERTIDVHIRRLRKALEPAGLDAMVQTVRGAGYRFSAAA